MGRCKAPTTLNIRLLRDGWAMKDAFTNKFEPKAEGALEERSWFNIKNAKLYVGKIYANMPKWKNFLGHGCDNLPINIFTEGSGAILFLPVANRFMAVCFGHIHLALNDTVFERQFGLKVTLNTVPRSQIRTIDIATPDAVTFKRRIQASKDSDLQKFGIDITRDLAQVAGGTPRKKAFAQFVSGKDSLSITCEITPKNLHKKCCEIFEEYNQTTYQEDFSWIDNMRIVSEKDLIVKLDAKLFEEIKDLREGKISFLHIAPPEIIDYTQGERLHYNGFGSRGTEFNSLSIDNYIFELNDCSFNGDMNEIKNKHKVKAADNTEKFTKQWKIYDCFVFETFLQTSNEEDCYILFSGNWYCVSRNFKKETEIYFEKIPKIEIIGKTFCQNEEDLIESVVATRSDLVKLDRQKINPKGERYANLEACDFFTEKNQFIHLKDGHSSAPISHLWSQGIVSAEAFLNDGKFRNDLRKTISKLKKKFKVNFSAKSIKARDQYTVVFGIMRKPYANNTLGLPFFSKISLRTAVERINQLGMKVAIELIEKIPSKDN